MHAKPTHNARVTDLRIVPAGDAGLLVELPARYVASEESALVNFLNGGWAVPVYVPPRPFETFGERESSLTIVTVLACNPAQPPYGYHAEMLLAKWRHRSES